MNKSKKYINISNNFIFKITFYLMKLVSQLTTSYQLSQKNIKSFHMQTSDQQKRIINFISLFNLHSYKLANLQQKLFRDRQFQIDFNLKNLHYYYKISLNYQPNRLHITCFIHNYSPTLIKYPINQTLFVCRFLNKLNSRQRTLKYKFNMVTNQVIIQKESIFTQQIFREFISQNRENQQSLFTKSLKQQFEISKKQIQVGMQANLYRIFYILGQTPNSDYYLKLLKCPIKSNQNQNLQQIKIIHRITNMISISHSKNTQYHQNPSIHQQPYISNFYNSINFIQKKPQYQNIKHQTQQIQELIKKHLKQPQVVNNNKSDKSNILNKIKINQKKSIKWQQIAKSECSIIYKSRVQFTYLKHENTDYVITPINRLLIRKKYFNDFQFKLNNQRNILKNIQNKTTVHVAKYYQVQKQNQLYGDYYSYKSFRKYYQTNIITLSLLTKIYIVCQVIQGLRFLHANKIYHLDIKPENMAIGIGIISRIIDFGDAVYDKKLNVKQLCFTKKYAALQLKNLEYNESSLISQQTDIYSLGIVMLQFFFNETPKNVIKQKLVKYEEDKKEVGLYTEQLFVCPERISKFGDQIFSYNLSRLVIKCLDKNPKNRPTLDWLLIILRQMLIYIDKLYGG